MEVIIMPEPLKLSLLNFNRNFKNIPEASAAGLTPFPSFPTFDL